MIIIDDEYLRLCDDVIDEQEQQKIALISFSRGKDSIASYLRIRDSNKFDKIYLFHYYLVPDLEFVNESLCYFKNKFNVDILNIPNWHFYEIFNRMSFQPCYRIYAYQDCLNENIGLYEFDYETMEKAVKLTYNLSQNIMTAVGVKSNDSMMRRTNIKKYGAIRQKQKKWYPIHDVSDRQIYESIKYNNIELPIDYELFGMTFDGLDYRFLKVIKDKLPNDYKKIKEWFPNVDYIIYRHEHYKGYKIKRGRWYGKK